MKPGRLRKNLWFISIGALAVAIAAGLVFLVSQTELLAVDEVVVEGNRVIGTEEIMDKAGPMLLGQSMLSPSFDNVSRAVGDFPYTESVEIERDFPHKVIIRIREYRSFVTLAAAEGKYVVLSSEGKALVAVPAPASNFPLLSTKEPCAAEAGGQVECPDVTTGSEFLSNIPTNFNQEIAQIKVADGDINLRTRSGVDIHFGTLEDFDLKFEVLRQLLARSAAAGQTLSIDVSVVERPVTKEGNTSTASTTAASSAAAEPAAEAPAAAEPATEAPVEPPAIDQAASQSPTTETAIP